MLHIFLFVLFLLPIGSVIAAELGRFEQERSRFESKMNCKTGKTTSAMYGLGRLYGCIIGKAETAKYFINEDPQTGLAKNIKVMWNDWFVDVGHGIHADKAEAARLVGLAAALYGPGVKQQLLAALEKNTNVRFAQDSLIFSYTFTPGPKINERLVTISTAKSEK